MSGLTDLNFFQNNSVTSGWQSGEKEYAPVEKSHRTTIYDDFESSTDILPTSAESSRKSFESPIPEVRLPTRADSIPLQIWEGTVSQVDTKAGVMHVQLNAKMGDVPRHSAEIELQWVSDQDKDLVQPGAVFYLTLFKRTKWGGSIENSQELRFRRRPSWSLMELKRIDEKASVLLSKMKALPTAE